MPEQAAAVTYGVTKAEPQATGRARHADVAGELKDGSFIGRCTARYRAAGFGGPGEAEVRAWRRSWPPMLEALVRAGLSDVQVYPE
ncbi:hypothetical protein [Streptomyces sp. NPDC005890]|uniref:hypothetical protein n=1 Tax=Streptomyces sp. NPDC005890 TaxID=3154568 RepID=UPI0033D8B80E